MRQKEQLINRGVTRLLLLALMMLMSIGAWAGEFTKTYNYFRHDTDVWKHYFCADQNQELGLTIGTFTELTIYSPKTYYRVSSVKVVAGVIAATNDFDDANVTVSANEKEVQAMTVLPYSQYPGYDDLNTIETQEYTFSFADAPLEDAEVAITFTNNGNPQYGDNGGIDIYVKSVTVIYESDVAVGGVAVNQENMSGITGNNISGTVTYDDETNTLTLTNADINGDIETSNDLNIVVIGGSNYIINGTITTTKENGTLTFKSGRESNDTLVYKPSNADATGFKTVNYNGLYLTADNSRDLKYSSTRQCFELMPTIRPDVVKLSSAKTYELWVGGTKVTAANQDNITSDFLTATENGKEFSVTYNPDSHKLSLKNVTLSGSGINNYGIISRLPALTIDIEGANEIICNDTCTAIRADAEMEQSLTFTTDDDTDYSLAFKAKRAVRNFKNVDLSYYLYWNNNYKYANGKLVDYEGNEVQDKTAVIGDTEYYGLSVAGIDVTSKNYSNITGDGIVSGKFSYSNKVLTIDGSDDPAVINTSNEYGIMNKSLSKLTIKLKGQCTINTSSNEDTNPIHTVFVGDDGASLYLVKDEEYDAKTSLQLLSNSDPQMEQSVISGFASVDYTGFAAVSSTSNPIEVGYDNYEMWMLDQGEPAGFATDVKFVPAYKLWVNGEQVTDENKDAVISNYILSGSSISFNSLTNTLTLNNVDGVEFDSQVPFIKNGLGNMTIHIVGENELHCGRLFLTQYGQATSSYNVTFTTDPAAPGSLYIMNTSNEGGDWYEDHTLSFRNELALTETEWSPERWFREAIISVPLDLITYGLVVGGVTVTPDNAGNIAEGQDWIVVEDGGELSFNPESNTLTMKDVTIAMPVPEGAPYPAIVTGLDRLTVNISGYNHIWFNRAEGDYSSNNDTFGFQSTNSNAELVITKETVEEEASLSIDTSKPAFDGFKSVTYEKGLVYDKSNMIVKGLETPSPYSYYNDEQKALEVGMEFAPIEGVTVYYSIDYADESKQDVENAVYNYDQLFISSPCTFTTYSKYGEYTSPVFKAKVFAFAEPTVTAMYGVDETVNAPALLPAVEDADQITVRYTIYNDPVAPALSPAVNLPVADIDATTGVITINKPGTIKFAATCTSDVVDCWGLGEYGETAFILTVNDVEHGIIVKKNDISVSITNSNLSDVLGDADPDKNKPASVQYDGHNRLVLNNAELTSIVVSAKNSLPESGLDIYLEGNSTITNATNASDYAISSEGAAAMVKLAFHTGSDAPGTLVCTNGSDITTTPFSGFDTKYYNNLAQFIDNNKVTVKMSLGLIVGVNGTTNINYSSNPGGSEGAALGNDSYGNVLYTLDDDGSQGAPDGYDQTLQAIVVNSVMTDNQVRDINTEVNVPGTPAYKALFKGLTYIVPAGTGTITLNSVKTEPGYAFHVMVGYQDPMEVINTGDPADYELSYACSEASFVKIYLVQLDAPSGAPAAVMAKDGHRIGPKTTVSGRVGGMDVTAASVSTSPSAAAPYMLMSVADWGKVNHHIDVTNTEVTDLADDAFGFASTSAPAMGSKRAAGEHYTYIDASKTQITGKSFSRTEGAFKGVPEETFIFLPAGNTAKGKNFIIGGICDNMAPLESASEKTFELATDFVAAKAEYDRVFTQDDSKGECFTVFLPYAIKLDDAVGEFFTYDSFDGTTVNMSKVSGMTTPNTPYIFRPAAEGKLKAVSNAQMKVLTGTKSAPGADVEPEGLHGVYEYYKWDTKPSNIYCYSATDKDGIKAGEFAKVGQDTHIKPFRAYLRISAISAPEFLSINWGDGTTSIIPLDKEQVHQDADGWYTISGFRLPAKPTEKGIYIHNSKKVVVK